jgi:hypothetical protein
MDAPQRIALSLVAHTNVGKTTLARTLLGRDVGEVRDEPHVTEFADVHTMLESPAGDSLQLWDTPGFGDSVRLLRRLRQSSHPIGWFLSQVWDRWRERPFWAAQQALKNVRDEADVLLYLVSVAETPEAAGYVEPELELLAWTGKPVVVLLNQLGTSRSPADGDDLALWQRHIAELSPGAQVLSFDAFARCWVQEIVLLEAIAGVLDDRRRPAMARLSEAWRADRRATFGASMAVLASSLGRVATARVIVADGAGSLAQGLSARLRRAVAALRPGSRTDEATARAQVQLAERLAAEVRESTAALIRLHRLEGESTAAVLAAVEVDLHKRVDAGWAAAWGGAVSGALAGLSTDVLSGGLTLGGGMIAGGVLGALGAAGIAQGVNRVRGTDRSWVGWKSDTWMTMVDAALLRYLAVAHFGRGRGRWANAAAPEHWVGVVKSVLEPRRPALAQLWRQPDPARSDEEIADEIGGGLEPILAEAAREVLQRLYPDAAAAWESGLPDGGGEIAQARREATP